MRALVISCVLVSLLSACSMADRSGCPQKDLELIGQEDGLAGREATLPTDNCQLAVSELQRYEDGRKEGLRRYCQAQRGYQLGLEGQAINAALCAGDSAKELERGFAVGDNLRQHLRKRDELLSQAKDAEHIAGSLTQGSPERGSLEQQAADARFQARQHDNEVEALRGVVAVEKWR